MTMSQTVLSFSIGLMMLGCQSTSTSESTAAEDFRENHVGYVEHLPHESVRFDTTSHPSQQVYRVQFESSKQFSERAHDLARQMAMSCGVEGVPDDAQERLKTKWLDTLDAWMALQGQERGPEQALELSWNVQFWPDKKNTTGRKMSQLVQSSRSWSQAEIANKSVTVQGLGSIEWLLYDAKSDYFTHATTCQTGAAIASNLATHAQAIHQAWGENPWRDSDIGKWHSEYIALLSNQLEYSMKKLSRPLAKVGQPRPYFVESWRSRTSLSHLKTNVMALQSLYFANGSGLDQILRQRGKQELADRIRNQFSITLSTWPQQASLFDALQTKTGYQMVLAQYNKLEQLKYLIHEEVAIELGVIIGFNATDGD